MSQQKLSASSSFSESSVSYKGKYEIPFAIRPNCPEQPKEKSFRSNVIQDLIEFKETTPKANGKKDKNILVMNSATVDHISSRAKDMASLLSMTKRRHPDSELFEETVQMSWVSSISQKKSSSASDESLKEPLREQNDTVELRHLQARRNKPCAPEMDNVMAETFDFKNGPEYSPLCKTFKVKPGRYLYSSNVKQVEESKETSPCAWDADKSPSLAQIPSRKGNRLSMEMLSQIVKTEKSSSVQSKLFKISASKNCSVGKKL